MGLEVLLGVLLFISLFSVFLLSANYRRKLNQLKEEHQSWIEKNEANGMQQKSNFEERLKDLMAFQLELQREKETLLVQLAKAEIDIVYLKEKLKSDAVSLEQTQQKFQEAFENLAQKILDEKTTKFTSQNLENMQSILLPLQDKIQLFEKKVESTHRESIDYHAALREQISGLKKTNELMSQETLNLTKALKGDSKVQGNWGELILETVLEKSGLTKDREYFVQPVLMHDDGQKLQPDVVIHLPD